MRTPIPVEEMLDIKLSRRKKMPLFRQLYEEIKSRVTSAQITVNTRLPASRNLATQLSVSRNTVQLAYDQLIAEGYLRGKAGSGVFVHAEIPDHYYKTNRNTSQKTSSPPTIKPTLKEHGNFTPGVPDLSAFPHSIWTRCCRNILKYPDPSLLFSNDGLGLTTLRQAIADYLKQSRSVNCNLNQIIITSGSQEAISLAIKVLCNNNSSIALENPGYRGAYNAAKNSHARIEFISLTEHGINLATLAKKQSKLIYVTPSHQYPMGMIIPISQRLKLLALAKKQNAYIIEDDYDSEFHFHVKPLPAMQGLDQHERVIYLGSFSKVMFPALRLGYLVLPKNLVQTFEETKLNIFGRTPLFQQAALADFMQAGHFSRHIKRMRMLYAEKHRVIMRACEEHLINTANIYANSVGLHITIAFKQWLDDKYLVEQLKQDNLFPETLSRYCHGRLKLSGLILGFGNTPIKEIDKGIKRLAQLSG